MAKPPNAARFTPKEQVLTSSQLFSGVSASLVRSFAPACERLILGRGDILWMPGDHIGHFHLVAFGAVKLQRLRPDSPVILGFFLPGESVADALVISRGAMPACAVAQSTVAEVLLVPAELVLAAAKRDAALAEALHAAVARQVLWLHTKIEVVTIGSVAERLSTFVLRLVERRGGTDSNRVEVPVSPTRVELASVIEARPETVTRALGKLAKDGVFTVTKSAIFVHDLAALKRIVPHETTECPASGVYVEGVDSSPSSHEY